MSALNTIYTQSPYSHERNEEIAHKTFFDVLYRELIDQVGEEQALHEVPYIFSAIVGTPLVEINFTDKDIQEKWESFRESARGLEYTERLKIFENSDLKELVGKMPPFYTFTEHTSYWQQNPDIKAEFSFGAAQSIKMEKLLENFPISKNLQDVVHRHNIDRKKGVDNFNAHSYKYEDNSYNLESVYTVVSLSNNPNTLKKLMQSEYDFPSNQDLSPLDEYEPQVTNDGKIIEKWLEQDNDLIAVYHYYGEDLSHFSQLAGVYGYNTHNEGVLEIVGAVADKGRNGIPLIMLEKAKAIAQSENLLIAVHHNINTGLEEYLPAGGKVWSQEEAQSKLKDTMQKALKEVSGNLETIAPDIYEFLLKPELYDLARQTRLGIQYQTWQAARQNGMDAQEFTKDLRENSGMLIHVLMRDVKMDEWFESSKLEDRIQHIVDSYEKDTWHDHIIKSQEFQELFTKVWDKLETYKPTSKMILESAKIEQEPPKTLKP